MLNNQSPDSHEPPGVRRTERDQQRRRALADAAAGFSPSTGRVKCLIYLSGSDDALTRQARDTCEEAAEAFCWEVADVIEEDDAQPAPRERGGLSQALSRLCEGEIDGIVTGWPSMISPSAAERESVEQEVRQVGGFLYTAKPADPAASGTTAGGTT
ncbi:recombinase family protein [Streptomyces luteoverticillatus]|uniref:Recombinase family protein n=2 Tax=Streptomyces luteoverticillatus TaxID=66425 RepID=A0A3S9PHU1_STRLT|nr:recombinase family protein [Streptomyces luteoverticillatus]